MHCDEIASVACCCMFNWLEFCCVFPAQALEVLACPAWISTPGKSFSAHTQCDHHLSCELFGLVLEGCNSENVECCNSIIHVNVGMF